MKIERDSLQKKNNNNVGAVWLKLGDIISNDLLMRIKLIYNKIIVKRNIFITYSSWILRMTSILSLFYSAYL